MVRKLIQSGLFLTLCPLLAAQQAMQPVSPSDAEPQPAPEKRYVTLPGDTNIELLAPGPGKIGREKAGSVVQFVVDRDVVFGGVPVVHAGVPVTGVVDYAKRGSHFKHRAGEMEIRVTETISGKPIELHLRCFDAGDPPVNDYFQPEPGPGIGPVVAGVITVVVLLILALLNGDR